MSLSDTFPRHALDKPWTMIDVHLLEIKIKGYNAGNIYTVYDFLTRNMYATAKEGGVTVTPFSQLDREVLEFMHKKLIELKGKPPELPALPQPDDSASLRKSAPSKSGIELG